MKLVPVLGVNPAEQSLGAGNYLTNFSPQKSRPNKLIVIVILKMIVCLSWHTQLSIISVAMKIYSITLSNWAKRVKYIETQANGPGQRYFTIIHIFLFSKY